MPNWMYVDYQIVGEDADLDSLYQVLKGIEEGNGTIVENGFGNSWLGNLVASLGGDPEKIECRGKWENACRDEDGIFLSLESAWCEPEETRRFLEERFPGIKIYFQCTGDGVWQTNDKEGLFFCRYYLYTEENGEDYYKSLKELIKEVEDITGASGINTLEDCEAALQSHYGDEDNTDFYLGEFDYVD